MGGLGFVLATLATMACASPQDLRPMAVHSLQKPWSLSIPSGGVLTDWPGAPQDLPVAFGDRVLYVATGPRVHAIDPRTGRLLWSRSLPLRPSESVAWLGSSEAGVFAATQSDRIVFFASNGGSQKVFLIPALVGKPQMVGDICLALVANEWRLASADGTLRHIDSHEPAALLKALPALKGDVRTFGLYALVNGQLCAPINEFGLPQSIKSFDGDLYVNFQNWEVFMDTIGPGSGRVGIAKIVHEDAIAGRCSNDAWNLRLMPVTTPGVYDDPVLRDIVAAEGHHGVAIQIFFPNRSFHERLVTLDLLSGSVGESLSEIDFGTAVVSTTAGLIFQLHKKVVVADTNGTHLRTLTRLAENERWSACPWGVLTYRPDHDDLICRLQPFK